MSNLYHLLFAWIASWMHARRESAIWPRAWLLTPRPPSSKHWRVGNWNLVLPSLNHALDTNCTRSQSRADKWKREVSNLESSIFLPEEPLKVILRPEEEEEHLHKKLSTCGNFQANIPIKPTIGMLQLWPMCLQSPYILAHNATLLLLQYVSQGYPVDYEENWTHNHIIYMFWQGLHCSAVCKNFLQQLHHETNKNSSKNMQRW